MDDTVPYEALPETSRPAAMDVSSSPRRLIAADVGGTFARMALVALSPRQAPRILASRKYACTEYPSLAAVLCDFRGDEGEAATEAVVAIAGVPDGDRLVNSNLAWPVSLQRTRSEAGLAALELVNDFEAVAHAIAYVGEAELSPLNAGEARGERGPALVLGPGTGLGAALRLPDGAKPVLPSEVGHSALAPGNELELEILHRLMRRWPHVDNERVLSGSGLMNLYPCLCEIRGVAPRWSAPAQLVAAAQAGEDALAVETLEVFCGWLGSLTGDLAIAFGARAVYLAGGISAHIAGFLHRGAFRQRYLNKGVLGEVLRQVPVWRVEHGQLGIVGAAACYAQRRALA